MSDYFILLSEGRDRKGGREGRKKDGTKEVGRERKKTTKKEKEILNSRVTG